MTLRGRVDSRPSPGAVVTIADPPGSALAAQAWARAIIDCGDLAAAWPLTHPDLRRARAQTWLGTEDLVPRRRWVSVADDLVDNGPASRHWPAFARWLIARWQTLTEWLRGRWGVLRGVQIVAVDIELVELVTSARIAPGAVYVSQKLTMRLVDDGIWLVAGIGRYLAVPGWPPTKEELPSERVVPAGRVTAPEAP